MPYPDFVLLAVAERIEPRGERREDLRAGIVAAAIANPFRGKHARAYRPSDFMPEFWGPSRQDPRLVKAQIARWVLARGGTVIEVQKG